MKKTLFLLVLIACFQTAILKGHGLQIDVKIQSPVVIVTSGYSETQHLAGGTVTVYSPADGQKPYQTGNTDTGGKFVFLPDREGEWSFIADDKKGHFEKVAVTITNDFFVPAREIITAPAVNNEPVSEKAENEIPVFYKIIFGLSLILGLTGFLYGIRTRQTLNK